MPRLIFIAAALLAVGLPAATAQGPRGSFGGGVRPAAPAAGPRFAAPAAPQPFRSTLYRARTGPRNGAYGGFYPYAGGYGAGGFGGGFISGGYGYGGFNPYFVVPGPTPYFDDPGPAPEPPPPAPTRLVELSGQFPATLTLDFPAPADVWLDGKPVPGEAAATRAVTSPVVRPGEQYTFRVKARWQVNGQTYEYARDVPLGPGGRSRLLVVSGTAVGDGK